MGVRTWPKKMLGDKLASLRKAAGLDTKDAAVRLGVDKTSLLRYEKGDVLPPGPAVQLIKIVYELTHEEIVTLTQLYDAARHEPASIRMPPGTPPALRRLVNAQLAASDVRTFEPSVPPGLLQTENVIDALGIVAQPDSDYQARSKNLIEPRLLTQRRLSGPSPMGVHAIMGEEAIRRPIGDAKVWRTQLLHLIELAGRPWVHIQIFPFSAGAYPTPHAFTITNGPDGSLVYTESAAAANILEEPSDVASFDAWFDYIATRAESEDATVILLQHMIGALEK